MQHLRNTYPGNENAFRQALEKAVLAAHEKAKQAAVVTPQQQQQQQHQPLSASNQQDANGQTRSFPGGRSYPGQQQAPLQSSIPNTSVASNTQQAPQGASYIPYARDTAPQARPSSYSSSTRRQAQPSSRDQQQQQLQSSGSNTSMNNINVGNATMGSNVSTRPGTMARPSHTAFNPAAIRPPKIQPVPVTSSRESLPPYFPISTSQAYMTTYPSRLKLGLTSLIQPISSSGQVISANPRAITSTASRALKAESSSAAGAAGSNLTMLGKRQRAKVDYTERLRVIGREESSEDEDGSNSDDDDDDGGDTREDMKVSRAQRAAKRSGLPISLQSSASTPRDSPGPGDSYSSKKRKEKNRDDIGGGGRTWLGQDPPGDLILVQPAQRHILPYM